ncbi:rhamnogalacturonan lyase [Allorhodopirellula solitaria]|nr:rhamnogalacturonan lyase [Allorhodopirellula solitaria]
MAPPLPDSAVAQTTTRQVEVLTRGVVAVPDETGGVLISWRLRIDDPEDIAFDVYRQSDGEPERINDVPITEATCLMIPPDEVLSDSRYFVRPVVEGVEGESSQAAAVWQDGFLEIPLQPLAGYRPGDASVGDLDGDGQYEIVVHRQGRTHDNSHSGITDPAILEAYELDGTRLWRIDLGRNIRDGEHYTQFMVYDLDGDGRAEVACNTADATRDGTGKVIGDADADWRTVDPQSRSYGRILQSPEFLTVFDGQTGKAMQTVDYFPTRDPIDGWGGIGGNGGNDDYGNRCDRFLACVAYLDGVRPSLVMCRGVYGRTVLAAWDWRDGELTQRWVFDSGISYPPYTDASPYSGMGGHSLSVADVDDDGCDEIVYQAMVIDDDGQGLYSTGLRHGDAAHVGDWIPDRPGLEVFTVQENEESTVRFQTPGAAMRDARTGEILWSHSPAIDVGSGLVADIDPRYRGSEAWGGPGGLRTCRGEVIGRAPRASRFAIWWDGDPLRELLEGSRVRRWDWQAEREFTIAEFPARGGRYPCLMGDILGDWREEVLLPSPNGRALRLFSTNIPTSHRIPTLMQNPQYRLGITWQNVVYNKPPHPSFDMADALGEK